MTLNERIADLKSKREAATAGEWWSGGFLYAPLSYETWRQFPSKEWDVLQESNAAFLACAANTAVGIVEELSTQLSIARDDLEDLDKACWHCLHPDSGEPERHVHEPNGGHWHHYIDPGDGLPSPCKNSDMLERVFAELTKERDALQERLRLAESLLSRQPLAHIAPHEDCNCRDCELDAYFRKES